MDDCLLYPIAFAAFLLPAGKLSNLFGYCVICLNDSVSFSSVLLSTLLLSVNTFSSYFELYKISAQLKR
ncbi:hypothetical protein K450DRAFT_226313 [Umbelopsis ramanniana AG]|uniref:Uncharacterized protein n=1 Tax=Umbelopsis ramanniana AG TaxID=1314678 RepID=A0AAD5EG72_UMBRA|nr:uncharacterized protein K450DRAFT_226313 [Umbelopsis ramanniana AG]KAI8582649.1 hypothetical protein K450DRAFT_226313 [Umbelopsis ramanniana AG]